MARVVYGPTSQRKQPSFFAPGPSGSGRKQTRTAVFAGYGPTVSNHRFAIRHLDAIAAPLRSDVFGCCFYLNFWNTYLGIFH